MNRQQAAGKALELYPVKMVGGVYGGVLCQSDENAGYRAAFMQCFDLMPTGSLPMTRGEAEDWAERTFTTHNEMTMKHIERRLQSRTAVLAFYDHLASLSSAAPAMRWVKANQEIPHDYDWVDTHFMLDGKKSDGCLDRQEAGKIVFEYRSSNGWQIVEDLSRIEWLDEISPSAPVGVTREEKDHWIWRAKMQLNTILALVDDNDKVLESMEHWLTENIDYLHITAPVSSAAQPATGYSEERGHSTNPNVQEKASIQPPLSAPEWLNKHNSGG